MFRNGRSARGEGPETDSRFFARPGAKEGRVVPTTANWGTSVSLLGSQPGQTAKLVKVDAPPDAPLMVTVASKYTLQPGVPAIVGLIAKGYFGAGGGMAYVEFDAKPDVTVQLPATTVDLDVAWGTQWTGTAGNVATEAVPTSLLPLRADVTGMACKGSQSRGMASRTQPFTCAPAGAYIIPCPPFADQFMWFGDPSAYANLTSIEFLTMPDQVFTNVLALYTGAQIQAIRNAGMTIPVPGIASAIRINTTGAVLGFATYYLSL